MDIFEAITYGFFLGIATALSPGPFIALVLAEALDGRLKNAIVISLTPLITDIPIIVFSLTVFKSLFSKKEFLSLVSFIGGLFLFLYGYKHIKTKRFSYVRETGKVEEPEDLITSLWKGILVNLLSPYTYIFWLFIATGFLLKSNLTSSIFFVASFFFGLIGSSILLAFLVYKGRTFLSSRLLVNLTKILGVVLILFGIRLFYEGIRFLVSS